MKTSNDGISGGITAGFNVYNNNERLIFSESKKGPRRGKILLLIYYRGGANIYLGRVRGDSMKSLGNKLRRDINRLDKRHRQDTILLCRWCQRY